MEQSPADRDRLRAAWHAVLARLTREGFSEAACAETMLDVAASKLSDVAGGTHAAGYLEKIQRQFPARAAVKISDLKVAALGASDEAFQWSEPKAREAA